MLKPGGLLVFFLPTVNDDYRDVDIPRASGMELVANSLQDFGKWGRRVRSDIARSLLQGLICVCSIS